MVRLVRPDGTMSPNDHSDNRMDVLSYLALIVEFWIDLLDFAAQKPPTFVELSIHLVTNTGPLLLTKPIDNVRRHLVGLLILLIDNVRRPRP